MPAEPKGAKWTPAPRVVGTIHYRQDQVGYLEDGYTHLFVVPAEGGTPRQLTNGKWSVGAGELRGGASIDWTPDSKSIVFDGNRAPDADMQYEASQLVRRRRRDRRRFATSSTQAGLWGRPVGVARRPNGRVHRPRAVRAHAHGQRSLRDPARPPARSDMRKISGDFDRDPINLRWAPDGSGLYFDADDHGARNVQFASIVGGVKPVTTGRHMLTFDSVSKDLVAAGIVVRSRPSAGRRARTASVSPARSTKLTDVNGDVLQGKQLAKIEEVTYTSTGNAKVQGWIVKPPAFDASKKYPLILEIHGGPFAQLQRRASTTCSRTSPRTASSCCTRTRAAARATAASSSTASITTIPGPDYDDLMAGVDTVVGKGYVDTSRMYVSGCSGGGVLSSWVIGHTDRFAAAAVRCPVIDWISMAGQTDVPLFTYSFFKKPFWEDPSDWLAQSSLMTSAR